MDEALKTQFVNHLKNLYYLTMACNLLQTSPKELAYIQFCIDHPLVFGMLSKKRMGLQSASIQLDSDNTNKSSKKGPSDKWKKESRIRTLEAHIKEKKGDIEKF